MFDLNLILLFAKQANGVIDQLWVYFLGYVANIPFCTNHLQVSCVFAHYHFDASSRRKPSREMFIKMQFDSLFKILTFFLLLLLFNRIDASSDVDIEELIRNENGNDNWPEEPENAIDDFELDSSPCGKDMFQCLTSRECIDKYQYCDYIVDCADGTDEIKCGTCDYRNGTFLWDCDYSLN